ncbi:MAG TPA: hypothetical protein VNH64_12095, partial [Parvularculaceae bacterium]|nr:hypothetical protein [Parvularculaceae bacterium]
PARQAAPKAPAPAEAKSNSTPSSDARPPASRDEAPKPKQSGRGGEKSREDTVGLGDHVPAFLLR